MGEFSERGSQEKASCKRTKTKGIAASDMNSMTPIGGGLGESTIPLSVASLRKPRDNGNGNAAKQIERFIEQEVHGWVRALKLLVHFFAILSKNNNVKLLEFCVA